MSEKREWLKAEIDELIQAYQKVPELWNFSSKSYKDRDKKQRALGEIAELFDTTVLAVSRKIHNLRNQFNCEMKKSTHRRSDSGKLYVSKWPYYKSLMFLKNGLARRPPRSKTTDEYATVVKLEDETESDSLDITFEQLIEPDSRDSYIPKELQIQSYTNKTNIIEPDTRDSYIPKEPQIQSYTSKTTIIEPDTRDSYISKEPQIQSFTSKTNIIESDTRDSYIPKEPQIQSFTNQTNIIEPVPIQQELVRHKAVVLSERDDQYDVFGKYIASELRNLSSDFLRKRMKRKLQEAIMDIYEEDEQLSRPSSVYIDPSSRFSGQSSLTSNSSNYQQL